MLIAATIAVIIFLVGFNVISGTMRARGESVARVRAAESARLFFDTLERDLKSAYADPTGTLTMNDVRQNYTIVDTYHTPWTTNTIDEHALGFYTRSDVVAEGSFSPDRYVFVRYYVNGLRSLPTSPPYPLLPHTMCREVQEFGNTAGPTTAMTVNTNPDQWSLFPDARQLTVQFKYWDAVTRTLQDCLPTQATHIEVRIVLFDQFAEDRRKSALATADMVNNNWGEFNAYRAFTKTFALPSALTGK
jgi:hypothetical protein